MYIPNEKQAIAHCATERFLGYGGAMGGGKSRWLCEMAKLLSIKYPGNLGVIARQSGPALKLSTQEVFFTEVLVPGSQEWKDLQCKFNKSEGLLYINALEPASRIWFTGLDSDNTERVKSLNLGFFGIDEATEVTESIYMMLCTRLRRKGIPAIARKGMVTANPEAGWIKRVFLDQQLGDHLFIQANYRDNPHLPSDYASLFDHMPSTWREKYLLGNWGAVSGLIYKEFNRDMHIIPYTGIPPEWRTFRGLDHGQQNPCACMGFCAGYPDRIQLEQLVGKDRAGLSHEDYDSYPYIFVYRLYHKAGLVADHKVGIADAFIDVPKPGLTWADPSIWRKDRQKLLGDGKAIEFTLADEYEEHPSPLLGLVRANNEVIAGINRVSTLFRIGHLFITDHYSMEPLIGDAGEILSYSWKQPKNDDFDWPEEPMKARDHACDALRYGVMSLPPLRAKEHTLIPYNSFVAARQRAIRDKRGYRGIRINRQGRVVGE